MPYGAQYAGKTIQEWLGAGKNADVAAVLGGEDDRMPMRYVSWEEAMQFCRLLTERERKAGRLPAGCRFSVPTEAQWEYACRAGSTTALYNGGLTIVGTTVSVARLTPAPDDGRALRETNRVQRGQRLLPLDYHGHEVR